MTSRSIFLSTLFLLPVFTCFAQTGAWKLAKDQNGIKVYTRHVDGYVVDELKAELNVKAPMNAVVAVITDATRYSDWIYSCTESSILLKVSETEQYQYQVNDLPYPFSDRDVCIHFKIGQDPVTKKVVTSSTAEPNYIPAKEALVRIPVFIGGYELAPQADGSINVTYQLRLEPGGSVPDWLVNLFIVKGPYESTLKLREMVESKKYDEVKFAFLN
ncbi:MAG: START domain-containing protein [Chitinophagales bacterium]